MAERTFCMTWSCERRGSCERASDPWALGLLRLVDFGGAAPAECPQFAPRSDGREDEVGIREDAA